jgi:hypothetical protein
MKNHSSVPTLLRTASVIVAVAFPISACADVERTHSQSDTQGSEIAADVTLVEGAALPPATFLTDDALVGSSLVSGQERALAGEASGGLMGWLSPVGVPSPDGSVVAYNSWTDLVGIDPQASWSQQGIGVGDPVGTPTIRMLDVVSGKDSLFAEGAFSIAWRPDGQIAYFQGTERDYRADIPYVGQVLVRPSSDAPADTWISEKGQYVVAAWAGKTLLVYSGGEGSSDLLAVDGPDQVRILGEHVTLIAVSPDASTILVNDLGAATARTLDVATGEVLDKLDLTTTDSFGEQLGYLGYGGSWTGNRIAAESAPGIAILDVSAGSLALDSVLSLPAELFPMEIHEPQFVDEAANSVVAWAPIEGPGGEAKGRLYEHISCQLDSRLCTVGPSIGEKVFYQVYNPSRMGES